jgi:glycosyltransferase involved in cell wall biosynthesis
VLLSGIRLLYVINGLGPGGAEQSLADLLPIYLARGIDPVIVCLKKWNQGVEPIIRALGCEVRFLPPGRIPTRVRALRRMALDGNFDLIHTTLFWSDLVGRLASVGTGVPLLTSLVNTTYDAERRADPNVGRFALWGIRGVDGWTARNLTTHFHAITHAVKDSAVRSLGIPADQVTVVERGRDRARLGRPSAERRLAAREMLGLPEDAEVVVNIGRQEYQKGQKHLLEAIGLLAAARPRLVTLIAGRSGHSSRDLQSLREQLGLGERLRFLGHREDAPDVLAAADVFAFPSVYEGLGGAVIEAMALGLPIVASDLPALREVVEEGRNAVLVKPASPASLAEGITRVLDDRQLASSFSARSLEIYQEKFTIERSAARMIELYRCVAAKPERAHTPGVASAGG